MNIALTGAGGLIGRKLFPFLKILGHSVYTISSSQPSDGNTIFSYDDLAKNKLNKKIDIFIHLASLNSNLAENDIAQEVGLTMSVLNAMQKLDCSKLIFFSTAKVYGASSFLSNTYTESSLIQPQCPYSKAKRACEDLIIKHSEELSIASTIFRLPPVLLQSKSSNLNRLFQLTRSGAYIPSFSKGNFNKRSFISYINIKNVIQALLESLPMSNSSIYNLSDNKPIGLNTLLMLHGAKKIVLLPKFFEKLVFKLPFTQNILIRLYGNFILENHKVKNNLNVKLYSTEQAILLEE
jgi:nucleoside-diphosphate-sugar epimerase